MNKEIIMNEEGPMFNAQMISIVVVALIFIMAPIVLLASYFVKAPVW
jgi:flagellar biogenesis protein FliO